MPGGFIGDGAKTVIPAKAAAKVSLRLVPDMEPRKVFDLYKKYVESICPKGITLECSTDPFGRCDRDWRRQSIRQGGDGRVA